MTSIAYKFVDDVSSINSFCTEMDRLVAFYLMYYSSEPIKSVCVAVSGGADSLSLLIMAKEWSRLNSVNICCVTVDHKLRNESAKEANFVGKICTHLGIYHKILDWNGIKDHIKSGKLETLARESRYRLITEFCEHNSVSILLVGHTWNDQLETFEMRKAMGSFSCGLASMSQIRSLTNKIKLFRPVIHITKNYLEAFLRNRNIEWVVDPMNNEETFLRVYHRKRINNYNDDKIYEISNKIILLGIHRNNVEKSAVKFLKKFCDFSKYEYATVEKISLLSKEKVVQSEILKRVIWNVGEKKYAPSITKKVYDQILSKEINTIGKCLIKVTKEMIIVSKENRKPRLVKNARDCLVNTNLNDDNVESILRQNDFDISKKKLFCLSSICQNYRIKSADSGLSNKVCFVNKVNLFDVFL